MATRREFLMQAVAAAVAAPVIAQTARAENAELLSHKAAPPRAPGIVQTVQGPLPASKLGFTLPHEHICASSAGFWQVWPEFFGGRAAFIAKVADKLKAAKDEGVDTIVDVTPADIGRDIRLLEELSRKSSVQIIACTGHWLLPSLSMEARTANELADFFSLEIERGIEGTGIKPGVIKVATDRDGVTPFLDRALRAAARASRATGIPVTTHTFAPGRGAEKQAAIFEEEGLNPAMVCFGHSDETDDMGYLTGLAKKGYTIGMDHLSTGAGDPPPSINGASATIPAWQRRAQSVKNLVDAGFVKQIFLSQDWYFDASMAPTGFMQGREKMNPDGILFVTRKIIPYLKQLGLTGQQLHTITVENPKRFFGGPMA